MQSVGLKSKKDLERIAMLISAKRQRPLGETKSWLDNFGGFLHIEDLERLCECIGYKNVFFAREELQAIKDTNSINDCFGISQITIKLKEPKFLNEIKAFIPIDEKSLLNKTPPNRVQARVKIKVVKGKIYTISYYPNYQNFKEV
ncbi:hypothetical protein [Campylobacter sp. MIT 97-5078]|uniref:hypothetical protein n=1 Tax=Campylobacter sp. MIT 97-5078 TaxID=1548153 RepID=UPI00051349D1|nr:hypothetical protein [Campylobacter sp. MIT 97-5078]KGI55235.1 hypothetical protein LR59_12880 [Campylobacter sp. MIT 97-5078]TQR27415.1 hypothetical protein DMB91_03930 [Campylobacter sp. MIT 97-5078]